MTIKEIATAFSGGQFQITFQYLSENVNWNVVGDKIIDGKESVIDFCNQTAKYFSEVTTDFKVGNIVVGDNSVAIDGKAVFKNKDNKKTYVSSCDLYLFDNGKLFQINSYCIKTNNENSQTEKTTNA
jgi:hypothetical protein